MAKTVQQPPPSRPPGSGTRGEPTWNPGRPPTRKG
jgi:hypothetical protein